MELPFEQELFAILICPESRAPLKWFDGQLVSTDSETRRAYPVEDGIPIMLIERSTILDQDSWKRAMQDGLSPADCADA
jgi:uncharacterized protein YbaR (Trm112 family)